MIDTLKILVKIGGSLCSPNILKNIKMEIDRLKGKASLILIPGGGPFANVVRWSYKEFNLDESSAHWMAAAAMDQYGMLLEGLGFGKASVCMDNLLQAAPFQEAIIFLPYKYLVKKDPLPHSWEITSDSIAAYLAKILQPDLFVLLKSADGLYHFEGPGKKHLLPFAPCKTAADEALVDSFFCRTLPNGLKTCIINGRHPERLSDLIAGKKPVGTFLKK